MFGAGPLCIIYIHQVIHHMMLLYVCICTCTCMCAYVVYVVYEVMMYVYMLYTHITCTRRTQNDTGYRVGNCCIYTYVHTHIRTYVVYEVIMYVYMLYIHT